LLLFHLFPSSCVDYGEFTFKPKAHHSRNKVPLYKIGKGEAEEFRKTLEEIKRTNVTLPPIFKTPAAQPDKKGSFLKKQKTPKKESNSVV